MTSDLPMVAWSCELTEAFLGAAAGVGSAGEEYVGVVGRGASGVGVAPPVAGWFVGFHIAIEFLSKGGSLVATHFDRQTGCRAANLAKFGWCSNQSKLLDASTV